MQRSETGFTLIEILLVLVIVSIVLSCAVLTINVFDSQRQIKMTAEHLQKVIITAEQQAVLMPEVLSLMFTPNGYEFTFYKDRQWRSLAHDVLSGRFSAGIHAQLEQKKRIVFNSSGDVTPFKLMISNKNNQKQYLLEMNGEGALKLKKINHDAEKK